MTSTDMIEVLDAPKPVGDAFHESLIFDRRDTKSDTGLNLNGGKLIIAVAEGEWLIRSNSVVSRCFKL